MAADTAPDTDVGWLTAAEVAAMRSYDVGGVLGDPATRTRWLAEAAVQPSPAQRRAGGPAAYLAALTAQVQRAGAVLEPVEVVTVDGEPYLFDGHHRAYTVLDTGLPGLPFVWAGPAQPGQGRWE